jgi:hypothetical protein
MTSTVTADRGEAIVRTAFAWFDARAMALATGILWAILMFVITAVLLLRGPTAGAHIGTHLGLLAQYFPGYSVSWSGTLIGAVYGFIFGGLLGAFIGAGWNFAHFSFVMLAVLRRRTGADL